ncbi:hypothetical protein AVEN_43402-1 [Araneus ventricosus]|uniref:Protein kinase domain-containing protein n=1 Tax=Araneus ventricosus TaxID=182803 RepID=A0A4Y2JKY4_ARAVE|nr:hypothetical protein AVEN_43402-1 [Araneus ventricosus]
MKALLPAVELTSDDIQMALNFVHSFLKSDPTARITAGVSMQHKFLEKGDFVSSGVDAFWQRPMRQACKGSGERRDESESHSIAWSEMPSSSGRGR